MAILLGVDTGGTYTDAVLIRDEEEVIATAKSLTTRHDLAIGIGGAVRAVLADSKIAPEDISMASLSTTLATNALVEGQGGRVALVLIGFSEKDAARQGLEEALKGDPVIYLAGGHTHSGDQATALDLAELDKGLVELADQVSGFAVAGQFATRNPAHEVAVRDMIRDQTRKPVSCSHELSAKLGGPKRAMTALLNARLIGMIAHLIDACEGLLRDVGIQAPLMVVRGDGALISADQSREKPIETILSGPAASIVGARWLSDETDAMVSDIGGTTTDVALLKNGRPMIDPDGARVGGLRTMVEAVAMRTTGLGGDSELHLGRDGLATDLFLGPRRVLPVSLLAVDAGEMVHKSLDAALSDDRGGEFAGRFVLPINRHELNTSGLNLRESTVYERVSIGPQPMSDVLSNRMELAALDRLVARGLVMISAVTPSDAAHVLGLLDAWNKGAAEKALAVFARQRNGAGLRIAESADALAPQIVNQLTEQTSEALLEAAFDEEGAFDGKSSELARHELVRAGLQGHKGILALQAGLNVPVIGLGASAPTYYGAVGKRLSTRMVLPDHAGVANAIGAVVGQIVMRETGEIASAGEGAYRVYLKDGPEVFSVEKQAVEAMESYLSDRAMAKAQAAGAVDIRLRSEKDVQRATLEAREVFVSASITVTASGRPRITAQ